MKLRCCPFCKNKKVGVMHKVYSVMTEIHKQVTVANMAAEYWVACDSCRAEGPKHLKERIAVRLWNRKKSGVQK